ncbi:MAG TPA: GlsB/YeaQ/YmgE family stress response membrane protein [Pyrinomonadaceae bacterium]
MQIVSLILIGLLVGIVAKLLMPGRDPGGFVVTALLGIAGSFVGALVASLMDVGTGWFTSFALAVIGAMLLLGLYRFVMRVAMRAS